MISLFRLMRSVSTDETTRLQRLIVEGRTRDLATIRDTDTVIEITLGYDPEFWCVQPGYVVDPYRALIEPGQLVIEHGKKLTEKSRLSFLETPVPKVFFRT